MCGEVRLRVEGSDVSGTIHGSAGGQAAYAPSADPRLAPAQAMPVQTTPVRAPTPAEIRQPQPTAPARPQAEPTARPQSDAPVRLVAGQGPPRNMLGHDQQGAPIYARPVAPDRPIGPLVPGQASRPQPLLPGAKPLPEAQQLVAGAKPLPGGQPLVATEQRPLTGLQQLVADAPRPLRGPQQLLAGATALPPGIQQLIGAQPQAAARPAGPAAPQAPGGQVSVGQASAAQGPAAPSAPAIGSLVRAAVAAPEAEAEVTEAGDFPALGKGLPIGLPVGLPVPPPLFRALDPMQGIR